MKYSIVERQEKIDEILYPEISSFLMLIKDQDRVIVRNLLRIVISSISFPNVSIWRSDLQFKYLIRKSLTAMHHFNGLLVYVQHVRRAAVLALSTAAHNKPNLIKGLLPELLPLLYDQTVIKVSAPVWFTYHRYWNPPMLWDAFLLHVSSNPTSIFFNNRVHLVWRIF